MAWQPGDRLIHRFNPDLGPGLVVTVEHRTVVVRFPETDTVLRLAADADAIVPLRLAAGACSVGSNAVDQSPSPTWYRGRHDGFCRPVSAWIRYRHNNLQRS